MELVVNRDDPTAFVTTVARELTAVGPQDLPHFWPILRSAIERVRRKAPTRDLPEDIYVLIKRGDAVLYRVVIEGKDSGFLVLQPMVYAYGKALHIYFLTGSSEHDIMALFSEELNNIAKGIYAVAITFASAREGWKRKAEKYGFKLAYNMYEKEIR